MKVRNKDRSIEADVLHTLAEESRIPGRYQIRIRPWQSTTVVSLSYGPNSGVGNLDMRLLSTGAGARGASAGTRLTTTAPANNSASQGTATTPVEYVI